MNPTQLAGLVKRVYPSFDMTNFSDRLKLQKFIYLMQSTNLNLGYKFSLYLHGPYSTQLARDGFDMPSFGEVDELKFEDVELESKFQKFYMFLGDKKDKKDIMEILGSLHLFHKLNPAFSEEKIIKLVLEKNSNFEEEEVKNMLEKLKQFREIEW
jgi:uncharacterized protein YwgA